MKNNLASIRTFVGAKDFNISRTFYLDWGFEELKTDAKMSYFYANGFGFYLQDYYVKDWIDNSMLFLEVNNLNDYWQHLESLELPNKYENVRLVPIKSFDWGSEGFIYDPSGVLWHIGEFKK